MAQSGKGKLNYRCPICFQRDLDIDMFYNKDITKRVHAKLGKKVQVWHELNL